MPSSRTVAVYRKLGRRLNRFPQRAPASPLLYKILQILFTREEARLAAQLPLRPFDAAKAAGIWKMDASEAHRKLHRMAARGLLLDILDESGSRRYVLPPPLAGFFEFSLMRVRADIDQKTLSRLFYAYLNVDEEFIRDLFLSGPTSLARVFVHEPALPAEAGLEVLDHERAAGVIATAFSIGLAECYCRTKMAHVGRACGAPRTICMTFNHVAASLIRHGHARRIDAVEGMDLLQQAYAHNLVQGGENVRRQVNFICNCCACCCEGLIAVRKYGARMPIQPAGFLPRIEPQRCNGCGRCARVCPAAAVHMEAPAGNGGHPAAVVDETVCLGCGICSVNCPAGAIALERARRRPITPVDTVHRTFQMALERGLLQNLIFDNQVLLSHRMLAAFLGAILRLPPIKRALANRQLQSLYLEALIAWQGDVFPERQPHLAPAIAGEGSVQPGGCGRA